MKTLRFFCILCFMLCFGAGVSQAMNIANGEDHSRPFKATIYYSFASGWHSGAGNATHLGLLTTVSSYTDILDGEGNVIATNGHDVFTAADGSELIMDWSAILNADFTEDGTFVFSGGTGRFENATGSGTLHAYLTGEYDIALIMTGTIVY
jgi:hypothetical protein